MVWKQCPAADSRWVVLLALFLCLDGICCAPGCPASSHQKEEIAAAAEHLMAIGQLHPALACGERLTMLFPQDPIGYDILARVCFTGGDTECCTRFSERAYTLYESDAAGKARSKLVAANCFASSQDWENALKSYRAGSGCNLLSNEELATAYNNLGNVFRMLQRTSQAIENYIAAAKFSPHFADAYFNAGGLMVESGRVEEGTEALWQAVRGEAASIENWRALAGALEGAGSSVLAARAFHTLLRLLPSASSPSSSASSSAAAAAAAAAHHASAGGSPSSSRCKDVFFWARSLVKGGDVSEGVKAAKLGLWMLA
eukprot:CAMPEP_0181324646 /NCGR_PEP_ID=MMETSP1101-20121128/20477_1 /TAXON_ID=46948 /ORGANISM="Rhodomonas abbreviata, Strain Caron Lab Isolate" /LENGTH=314 /DNA_ID=CAMNT_0023432849 /DNA_START=314 /DNA_END=1255 /DNA_ORIENTATION=+